MGKEAHFDLYLSKAQKVELLKLSKKIGISASKLLLKGLSYWLSHKKDLEKEADKFKALEEIREAKERQRCSGDYLGSFEKFDKKMDWIDSSERKGRIPHEEAERLRKCAIHYCHLTITKL